MEKLGEYLKAKREEKGLTLKEVADRTRISMTFLQALEDGDYKVIPGEVFISGFLRSYAKELGLKEKDVMSRYRETGVKEQFEQAEAPKPAQEYLPGRQRKKGPVSPWVLYVILAAVALTAVIYYIAGRQETPEAPVQQAPKTAEQVTPPAAPVQMPATTVTALPGRSTVTVTPKPAEKKPEVPQKAVSITLKATSTSWYSVSLDGAARKTGLLYAGNEITLGADNDILLDIGNAGGVEIIYKDKSIGPLGPMNVVKRGIYFSKGSPGYIIKPAGVTRPAMPAKPVAPALPAKPAAPVSPVNPVSPAVPPKPASPPAHTP